MAWAAYLRSDGALLGYGSVPDGTQPGAVDRATMTDVPAGAMTYVVFPIQPDLPTDATYYYDQVRQAFLPEGAGNARAPSQAEAAAMEALMRIQAGENPQAVLRDLDAKRILPPGMLP